MPERTCAQWEVVDLDFSVSTEVEQPFAVEFGAVFTHEDGRMMRVPGFFDGGRRWVVRFSPGKVGDWRYRTYSSQPELAGKAGLVSVSGNTRPDRHGAIVIPADNKRKLA